MAQENEIIIEINAKLEGVTKALAQIESATQKTSKDIDKNFKEAGNSVSNFLTALGGITAGVFAFNKIENGIKSLVRAGIDAENSTVRLNQALLSSGNFSQGAVENFEKLAKSIQATTAFDDNLIISQISLAANLGLTNEQIEKVVKASVDLSAATGKDLNQTTQALAKTYLGFGDQLGRILPLSKNLTDQQLKNGEAIKLVEERFKGFAVAVADTFGGSVQRAENNFNQLIKTIGEIIISNEGLRIIIKSVNEFFVDMAKVISDNKKGFADFVQFGIAFFINSVQIAVQAATSLIIVFDRIVLAVVNIKNNIGGLISSFFILTNAAAQFVTEGPAAFERAFESISKLNKDLEKQAKENKVGFDERVIAIDDFTRKLDKLVQKVGSARNEIDKTIKDKDVQIKSKIIFDKKEIEDLEKKITEIKLKFSTSGLTDFEKIMNTFNERRRTIEESYNKNVIDMAEKRNLKLENENNAANEIFESSAKNISSGVANLLSSVRNNFVNFGQSMLGVLVGIGKQIKNGAEGAKEAIGAALGGIVAAYTGSQELGSFVSEIFKLFAGPRDEVEKRIDEFANGLVDAIVNFLNNTDLFLDAGRKIVLAFANNLDKLIVALINGLTNLFDHISFDETKEFVQAVIEAIIKAIIRGFSSGAIGNAFVDLVVSIVKFIVGLIKFILFANFFEDLAKILPDDFFTTVKEKFLSVFSSIGSFIVNLFRNIFSAIGSFFSNLFSSIGEFFKTKVFEAATGFVKRIIDGAGEFVKVIAEKVKDALSGLAGSIGGAFGGGGGGGGGPIGAVKGVLKKFATGGIVDGGAPFIDRVPALLTPGEFVIDRSQNKQLQQFLDNQEASQDVSSLLDSIKGLAGGNQNLTVNLMIGEDQLANAILNLNRRGFRTV